MKNSNESESMVDVLSFATNVKMSNSVKQPQH